MKTSTLITLGVIAGAAILIARRKPGLGEDLLVPPPGRTLTASGQVLGGLGLHIDAYDATPSQYRRTVINDLGALASKGRKGTSAFSSMLSSYAKKQNADAAKAKEKQQKKLREAQIAAVAQQKVNETLTAIQKKAEEDMAAQRKAEADAVAARQQTTTTAAPSVQTNYDVAKAAFEQASMSRASDDSGYGPTSDDTGYGTTQQYTEEGAPQVPEQVTAVETPSAQMMPPAAAPKPAGDTKVGLLVGGGVLAAIAAAMAT